MAFAVGRAGNCNAVGTIHVSSIHAIHTFRQVDVHRRVGLPCVEQLQRTVPTRGNDHGRIVYRDGTDSRHGGVELPNFSGLVKVGHHVHPVVRTGRKDIVVVGGLRHPETNVHCGFGKLARLHLCCLADLPLLVDLHLKRVDFVVPRGGAEQFFGLWGWGLFKDNVGEAFALHVIPLCYKILCLLLVVVGLVHWRPKGLLCSKIVAKTGHFGVGGEGGGGGGGDMVWSG